jgi:hypothetical protein
MLGVMERGQDSRGKDAGCVSTILAICGKRLGALGAKGLVRHAQRPPRTPYTSYADAHESATAFISVDDFTTAIEGYEKKLLHGNTTAI